VAGSNTGPTKNSPPGCSLLETPGVGRESARRLLAACRQPPAVLQASPALWRGRVVSACRAQAMGRATRRLCAAWRQPALARRRRAQVPAPVLTLGDADYPPLLLQTPDPRWRCTCKAMAAALRGRAGHRRQPQCHRTGRDNARAFAAHLSRRAGAIVSGLAAGIDGAAHEGGLDGTGGTVAVVGTGLDRVYPRGTRIWPPHRRMPACCSASSPGNPAAAANFPQRNRIIAGLSRGTLVVEAALQSGSLITARHGRRVAGREVFAMPGSIHSAAVARLPHADQARAPSWSKASMTSSTSVRTDGAGAGGPPSRRYAGRSGHRADASQRRRPGCCTALGHDPVTLDALGARTGWSARELSARLLELELDGQVARLPGRLVPAPPTA
jgi:DNA processing protein